MTAKRSKDAVQRILTAYFHPRVFSMAVLGFPYGMMFFLAVQTLQAWLSEEGISTAHVGFFSFVTLPYIFKVFWAPLIGFIRIPFLHVLGSRRSWLVFSHLCLIVLLNLIAYSNPKENLLYVSFLSFLLVIFASIQDIVVDAYRIEILDKDQAGPGVGMLTAGYRLGAFAATFGTLTLADAFSWQAAYTFMSTLVSMGIIAALLNPEPEEPKMPRSLEKAIKHLPVAQNKLLKLLEGVLFKHFIPPFREFFTRKGCFLIIFFIVFYRIGDAFIHNMSYPFYFQTGFSKKEIADITKFFGMIPTLIGGLIGGAIGVRMNIYKALFLSGGLHALCHIMFIFQAMIGYDPHFLYYVIFLEHITGGVTTAIFLLYLSREAHPNFVPTQYAFFTSLWSLPTFIAGVSGAMVEYLNHNWPAYFLFCLLISLPSLALVALLKKYRLANPGGLAKPEH